MGNLDDFYVPELTRLMREGIEINVHYELARRGLGVLTLKEAKEDYIFWKERISMFYNKLGWNSNLVNLLDNN